MRIKRNGMLMLLVLSLAMSCVTVAQSQAPSVLSRLQTVEDPELGELIRVAIENRRRHYEQDDEKELEIMRKVTESYAQIKLLDRQIELLEKKVGLYVSPNDLQYELILAQAELETKRTTELASLREIVGVIPDYALGSKPDWKLKTCLRLDVIADRVYVTEAIRPFSGRPSRMSYSPGKLMTKAQALESVKKRFAQKDGLPIRIDIFRNASGVGLSQEIERSVIELIHKAGVEMQAEVHLDASARQEPWKLALYLERGRIATTTGRSPSRSPEMILSGFIEPNEVDQYIRQVLLRPGSTSAEITLIYGPDDIEFESKVTDMMQQVLQKLDLTDCVEIIPVAKELDPARRFLGKWTTEYQGEELTMEVRENSNCMISDGQGKAQRTRWSFDNGRFYVTSPGLEAGTSGHINPDGDLVVEPGGDEGPVVFKRVE